MVAVLKRRTSNLAHGPQAMIANANQHAFEFYKTFTDILIDSRVGVLTAK